MLVAFCSITGSPGVSAWAVLLAGLIAEGGQRDIAVVEADVSGGVMATRYGVGVMPGAAELAIRCAGESIADAAPDGSASILAECGRRVADRAWMVPAPVVPTEAAAVWSERNCGIVASTLAADATVWIVDVGRFGPTGWVWHEAAVETVVLIPGWTDALVCAKPVLSELAATGATRTLIVGKSEYGSDELSEFLGTDVGVLPRSDVVEESASVWASQSRWRRGPVWSAGSHLAAQLDETMSLTSGVA